jgi:hypothetical protein
MTKKSAYVTKMETQLKNWNSDVDALAAEGEKLKGKARAAYSEQVKNLRASSGAAHKAFEDMRIASETAAEQMQAAMETAWASMQKTLKRVSSDLRR